MSWAELHIQLPLSQCGHALAVLKLGHYLAPLWATNYNTNFEESLGRQSVQRVVDIIAIGSVLHLVMLGECSHQHGAMQAPITAKHP